ncbi:MAG TPA: hypothetical protein VF914_18835 [Chloroflexia bacterium]|jgi:hypothetical protein
MNKERRFYLEIVGAFLAVLAGLIAYVASTLGVPFEVYLPVLISFSITAAASLLRREILNYLDDRNRIYQLIDSIKHDDLRQRALEIVDQCESALEDLAKGIVKLRAHEVFKSITDKMNATRKHVQGSHLALESSFIYVWEDVEGVRNYYLANLAAIKRGVVIERVFILRKSDILDPSTGKVLDPRAIRIMQQQSSDGIEVTVTWIETVTDLDVVQDFIIFDDKEVQVNYPMWGGRYYNMSLKREPLDLRQYQNTFADLKASGQPLAQFLHQVESGALIDNPSTLTVGPLAVGVTQALPDGVVSPAGVTQQAAPGSPLPVPDQRGV